MKKLIAIAVASFVTATAFAQTNATPPVVPAAGTPSSTAVAPAATPTPSTTAQSTDKKDMAKSKRAARKMKRAEKVGDKPLN